ncbi:hypothetical protein [Burkholderia sp. Bp8998]|uniref:hypothetical protein n=1 Tax=Burkholderia sp. Bp8998 TaxID=2184557 RepID=UPI0016394DE9|nr:hypothetical protein [Burkholderia sp. Bp8998]
MDSRVNLATLPEHETLARARVGGRAIFGDEAAVSACYHDLLRHWTDKNIPNAVGQSDDEFGDLLGKVCDEFEAGVDEAIKAAQAESLSIPSPSEGEASAEKARLAPYEGNLQREDSNALAIQPRPPARPGWKICQHERFTVPRPTAIVKALDLAAGLTWMDWSLSRAK